PVVARGLAFGAAPDAALVRFSRVVEVLRQDERLADRLADRPDAARRLISLVGVSSAFADALVARPELATALVELPAEERALFATDLAAELVRLAGAFAGGDLLAPDLGRRLASLCDDVVAAALDAEAPPIPMAVIGLGRLGAEELSFAS